ncbi:MAG: TerD family protein [Bacteroidetes bacterium]|nr:MAG: TerD family protein [Bacteroidota bacterium]
MNLSKSTGISLTKGSKISLEKNGQNLSEITIGLNWGAIKTKGFLGIFDSTETVDLDGTIATFDSHGNWVDTVYYKKLVSNDKSIRHSGDDRTGDTGNPDEFDNEIIYIDLSMVAHRVSSIFIFLNSYKNQDFDAIPYSKVRIYEGNPQQKKSTYATFNLSKESSFVGKVSMIMGKVVRKGSNWEFKTIGEAIDAKNIDQTIDTILEKYVSE